MVKVKKTPAAKAPNKSRSNGFNVQSSSLSLKSFSEVSINSWPPSCRRTPWHVTTHGFLQTERLLSKLWQMKCKVVVEDITKIAKFTKQRQMHSKIKQTNKQKTGENVWSNSSRLTLEPQYGGREAVVCQALNPDCRCRVQQWVPSPTCSWHQEKWGSSCAPHPTPTAALFQGKMITLQILARGGSPHVEWFSVRGQDTLDKKDYGEPD